MACLDIAKRGLRAVYVLLLFVVAFFFGFLKALLVGPVAALVMMIGNGGVLLGLFPAHVVWTVYTLFMTNCINAVLKFALLLVLPVFFALWLGLGITATILGAVGYGIFTPWVSTFEAFREDNERYMFYHIIVDGTWSTIKGCYTAVGDFKDVCYHSYPLYLKELRENLDNKQPLSIRLIDIPKCIIVGLLGLVVEIPLYTLIALVKSPLLLFKGWQRLIQDLISREGLFLESVCIPVAGLAILLWPLVVVGSFLAAVVSSVFIGLYASVVVFEENSFRRGVAFIIAMVAEFDEYTNDWLYLREGSLLPKPRYRKKKVPTEYSVRSGSLRRSKTNAGPLSGSGLLVPSLAPARSVREVIQEVKMVQIWEQIMKSCEQRGKELVDAKIITTCDLSEWLKQGVGQGMVGLGLPSFDFLCVLLNSVKAGLNGILLIDGTELTHINRPQDRMIDWFFHPITVLMEQMKALNLKEEEEKFLQKLVLFADHTSRMDSWNNGSVTPQDPARFAQIQAISRRLVGISRAATKFPTYRRRYIQVVRVLLSYSLEKEKEESSKPHTAISVPSLETTCAEEQGPFMNSQ